MTSKLFTPIQVGRLALKHRVALAPLTRSRATMEGNEANPQLAPLYYGQRASEPGTLIITEGTQVSQQGGGYLRTPGIHTAEQTSAWKNVVSAVHDKQSLIAAQLWHVGRLSHSSFQANNELPVAPSAIASTATAMTKNFEFVPYETPTELTIAGIQEIVGDFVKGAKNAKDAGFDAIEIHGANGYLVDQFIQDGTNKREDKYGGSIHNRIRFLFEILDGVQAHYSLDQIGVRLAPWGNFGGISDSDAYTTFTTLAKELNKNYKDLAYLHIVEPGTGDGSDGKFEAQQASKAIRPVYKGVMMSANGYNGESAKRAVEEGRTDMVAFGRSFLANPDLPKRLKNGLPLNEPKYDSFYTGEEKGYVDYPFHE